MNNKCNIIFESKYAKIDDYINNKYETKNKSKCIPIDYNLEVNLKTSNKQYKFYKNEINFKKSIDLYLNNSLKDYFE